MMQKKFKVNIFEISLTESTDQEREKYENLMAEWQKTLPEKLLMLDDTVLTNLFYDEKWDILKKELPLTYKIYRENCSILINNIAKRMEEINDHDEYMREYRKNHKK